MRWNGRLVARLDSVLFDCGRDEVRSRYRSISFCAILRIRLPLSQVHES